MRTVQTGCVSVRASVRPSVQKKRDFSQQFLGGGHMLESKHDLKLENCWIFQGPEKRGPKFRISG